MPPPPCCDRVDLRRRLLRALDLAESVLSSVDPPSPLAGIVEKVVAETAMLLLCASAIADDHPGIAKGVHHVARRLAPLARSDAVLATLCLQPALARDVALAHAALSRLGHPDSVVDAMLTAALAAAGGAGPERPPHRQLEQEWIARLWPAAATGLRRVPGLAAQSMLGRPVDALTSTRDDLYAFTHAVMYLTDLGSRQVNLPRCHADITADAEAGLALSVDTDDYDLTAELLLSWTMLGLRWTPAAVFAFQCVAGVADDVGFLPGRS